MAMQFVLKPYNKGLNDEELLDDLRSTANKLGKEYVTKEEYNKHGRLCSATFQKRFGSWCKAHDIAGLNRNRHYDTSKEECIADIKNVAYALNTNVLTVEIYEKHGKFNSELIRRRLGSFKNALDVAGLETSDSFKEKISNENLFENIENMWEMIGRQPSRNDFYKPLSKYSYTVYPRRFGSYRKALEAFVDSFEYHNAVETDDAQNKSDIAIDIEQHCRHKTSRNVSWRMRFLVMRRDNFKCMMCGVSPAMKPGTVLVIDHVTPWESGGETEFENLQTLCEQCNGGKSNLSLTTG
ncbi:MAG: HNH endonuclease [Proteobacteria bacterium]|nr:HNH endonuclease [Pseudomonadota bacterium]MBU1596709.1 HNH endonuclease [Pseudomonadota bacterium]